MNLSNTRLVILSACQTGLGDIHNSEGVYGLIRAFKMAGVDNLIVSLWNIPNAQTIDFMTTFYEEWLGSKKTINQAFIETQRQMSNKYEAPYHWAGFILVK